jgi:hypothetical protein
MNLENRLGDVETNRRNRLHSQLLRIVGAFNSAHIFGTLVPVEEPSTASPADIRNAARRPISGTKETDEAASWRLFRFGRALLGTGGH